MITYKPHQILAMLLIPSCAMTGNSLSWQPVTTDIAGGAANITSYRVLCGDKPGNYSIIKDVGLVLEVLAANVFPADGVYYCSLVARNEFGPSERAPEVAIKNTGGTASFIVPARPGRLNIK